MSLRVAPDLLSASHAVARGAAAPYADEVDRLARFPTEAIEAAGEEGLLAALVPAHLGGPGLPLDVVGESVATLASACSSTGMIAAMHHLQVACLARHGGTAALESLLERVATDRVLIASATTEEGIGGQLRVSSCALERSGGEYRLEKRSPTLSYAAHSQAILATARRNDDSPPNDQVLVACVEPRLELEETSVWDALGMRGTCSGGVLLRASGDEALVFPEPFGEIAEQTMLPVSHVLWAYVWLGIADAAFGLARRYAQGQARKSPGERPASALRLAELSAMHLTLSQLVQGTARTCEAKLSSGTRLGYSDMVALNSLKVTGSRLVVDIATEALRVCGMAGYSLASPYSLSRLLRDAHSGAVMISNDRLLHDNADMLAVTKETTSWGR